MRGDVGTIASSAVRFPRNKRDHTPLVIPSALWTCIGVFDDDEGDSCWGETSPSPLNVMSNESDLFGFLVFLGFESDLPMRPFGSITSLSPGFRVTMTGKTVRGDRGDVGG